MSPSAFITTRLVKDGKRYVVRYRRGGRMSKLEWAGSFKKVREANARRDFVAGELAAGRDPRIALAALGSPAVTRSLRDAFEAFIASRVDVSEKTRGLYANARDRLGLLAERDPVGLRPADFQAWVAANRDLSSATLGHYLSSIRQVMDFCEVEPNPARSRLVKLPSGATAEVEFPDNDEWRAIAASVRRRSRLALRLIEADALRVSEAVQLTYGDVDFVEGRIRISRARTKRRSAGQRWLPVPGPLLDEIAALVPLEDRARDRAVFPGLTDSVVRDDLELACRHAGIAAYHPHQLRHRRCSLWLAHGLETVFVKQWSGHSKASLLTDVYGHVVIDPAGDEWREFWLEAYARDLLPKGVKRARGEHSVRTGEGDDG